MKQPLLHIFRNTPFGRETLLQSAYACRTMRLELNIFIPEAKKFLFYFDEDIVQVDLDKSYLHDAPTARQHVEELLNNGDTSLQYCFIEPKSYTGAGLPDLPIEFSMMTCPRSMSDITTRIGLGHIGPKVRRLLQIAAFPVLIPSGAFKPWQSITVLYGGSSSAADALRLAVEIHQRSNLPLHIISMGERDKLEQALTAQGLMQQVSNHDWQVYQGNTLKHHLYHIDHDSLVVLGAYGHGAIKALMGSSMELIQSQLPNSLLVVGPHFCFR